jgi:hypothetical protein
MAQKPKRWTPKKGEALSSKQETKRDDKSASPKKWTRPGAEERRARLYDRKKKD